VIAVAVLDGGELGHVAGDAAVEHERVAERGDGHPAGLEHLVGEVAAHPDHAVHGEGGAAVGRDHDAVLAHDRHRQSHRKIIGSGCDSEFRRVQPSGDDSAAAT
jgi:hypothetical protein